MRNYIVILLITLYSCSSYKGNTKLYTINDQQYHEIWDKLILRCLTYGKCPSCENNMGFISLKNTTPLKPKFQKCFMFIGKYANVIKDNVAGYVDKKGKIKLFPQFDFAFWYADDFGYAVKNNKAAVINRNGKLLTEFKYDDVSLYNEGYALVKSNGIYNFVDINGNEIFDPSINLNVSFIADGMTTYADTVLIDQQKKVKTGIINTSGKIIVKAKYDEMSGYFSNGLMHVQNKLQGFINTSGEEVIPLIYQELDTSFHDSLVCAKLNGKWGFIDQKNQIVIPFIYDKVYPITYGLALVTLNGKSFFIDKASNVIIPHNSEYTYVGNFRDGLAKIKKNGKSGFIDLRGNIKILPTFDSATFFKDGFSIVAINGKKGVINKDGKAVVPIIHKEISLPYENFVHYQPFE